MRTVLITGANSGIGRATAVRLAAAGDRVYAGMRDTGKAEKLLALVAEHQREVQPLALDVTDATFILVHIFLGGAKPVPFSSADVNSDDRVDVAGAAERAERAERRSTSAPPAASS